MSTAGRAQGRGPDPIDLGAQRAATEQIRDDLRSQPAGPLDPLPAAAELHEERRRLNRPGVPSRAASTG